MAALTHTSLPKVRLGSAGTAARVRSGLIPQPQRSLRVIAKTGCLSEPPHLSHPRPRG